MRGSRHACGITHTHTHFHRCARVFCWQSRVQPFAHLPLSEPFFGRLGPGQSVSEGDFGLIKALADRRLALSASAVVVCSWLGTVWKPATFFPNIPQLIKDNKQLGTGSLLGGEEKNRMGIGSGRLFWSWWAGTVGDWRLGTEPRCGQSAWHDGNLWSFARFYWGQSSWTRVKIDLLVSLHPCACAFVRLLALLSADRSLPGLRWCYPRLPASCLLNKKARGKGKFLVLWIGMMGGIHGHKYSFFRMLLTRQMSSCNT